MVGWEGGIRKEFNFFVGTQAVVLCRTADAKIIKKIVTY
jgi:hypothetical protein